MEKVELVKEAEAILSIAKTLEGMSRENTLRTLAMSAIAFGHYHLAQQALDVLRDEYPDTEKPADAK